MTFEKADWIQLARTVHGGFCEHCNEQLVIYDVNITDHLSDYVDFASCGQLIISILCKLL
jgi:hypothetical protein